MAAKQHQVGISHPTVVPTNFDPEQPTTEADSSEDDEQDRPTAFDPTVPSHR